MKRVRVHRDYGWPIRYWRWFCPNCAASAGEPTWLRAFGAAFRHAQACPGHP